MALLNSLLKNSASSSSTAAPAKTSASTSTSTAATKKKGEIYLNVGFKIIDPATNQSGTIYLPFGMDLESMPSLAVSGSDENQLRNSLRNQLIDELVAQGKDMEPGTAKVFDGSSVEVELRRKNSVKDIKTDLKFNFKFI